MSVGIELVTSFELGTHLVEMMRSCGLTPKFNDRVGGASFAEDSVGKVGG